MDARNGGDAMTDLTKLADALDAVAYTHRSETHQSTCREAARILRAAAGVDVAGLMKLADVMADAACEHGRLDASKMPAPIEPEINARAALESALRMALAAREGFVMVPEEPPAMAHDGEECARANAERQAHKFTTGNGWGESLQAHSPNAVNYITLKGGSAPGKDLPDMGGAAQDPNSGPLYTLKSGRATGDVAIKVGGNLFRWCSPLYMPCGQHCGLFAECKLRAAAAPKGTP